jgi:hypothetical protein
VRAPEGARQDAREAEDRRELDVLELAGVVGELSGGAATVKRALVIVAALASASCEEPAPARQPTIVERPTLTREESLRHTRELFDRANREAPSFPPPPAPTVSLPSGRCPISTAFLPVEAVKPPSVAAPLTTPAPLNPSDGASVVASAAAGFRRCYNKSLARNPDALGSVRITARVGANGCVTAVNAAVKGTIDAEAVTCVMYRVRQMEFAAPASGGAKIIIPITFVTSRPHRSLERRERAIPPPACVDVAQLRFADLAEASRTRRSTFQSLFQASRESQSARTRQPVALRG